MLHGSCSRSRFIPGAASSPVSSSTSQALHPTSVNETYGTTQIPISSDPPTLNSGTEFTTHVSHECTFLNTHKHPPTNVNSPGYGGDPDDDADIADTADADIFEILHLGPNHAAGIVACPENLAPPLEDPVPPSIESDPDTSEHTPSVTSPVTIDLFPNGRPGAPISDTRGSHMDDTSSEVLGRSIWAPFTSQCDWEVARWAKMRSLKSSAVSDLLAIPEV